MADSLRENESAFERAHKARFGFIDRDKTLVIEAVSVEAVGGGATFRGSARARPRATKLPAAGAAHALFLRRQMAHARASIRATQLSPGHKVKGPAIIIEPHQTVVVEHGWQAELTGKESSGAAARAEARAQRAPSAPTPIR